MEKIDFTLMGDGPSDKCLVPILKWAPRHYFPDVPLNGEWADPSRSCKRLNSLSERIWWTIEHFESDLLFIHRDAEAQPPDLRYQEINDSMTRIPERFTLPYICVIPVRMTEAWLLFDEQSIRKASGNPNGRIQLALPDIGDLESIPDPKKELFNLLEQASELRGRQKRHFNPAKHRYRIPDNITDFSPLRRLKAFQRLMREIDDFSQSLH